MQCIRTSFDVTEDLSFDILTLAARYNIFSFFMRLFFIAAL